MKLKRRLVGVDRPDGPSVGKDVTAVQRALGRAGLLKRPSTGYSGRYGLKTEDAVVRFQRRLGLQPNGIYGRQTHRALWGYFDAYARWLYFRFRVPRESREDKTFKTLLKSMREMSDKTPGYLLGGGHGVHLSLVSPRQKLDCSSSTSKALYDAGLFPYEYAWVSGRLAREWGSPGRGRYFTVYANDYHVFVRLHKSRWWRFDTSPRGDGGRGPKLRYLPRFTSGFATRHYPGL
jgi:hypothetical protein